MSKRFPLRRSLVEFATGVALTLPFIFTLVVRRLTRSRRAATPTPASVPDGTSERDSPPAQDEGPEMTSRRRFLQRLSLGAAGLSAAAAAVPVLGFLFAPAREEPVVWRPVGTLTDFPIGQTVKVVFLDPEPLPWAGFAAETAAWLRRETEQEFVALSGYCTHVGCPVRWLPEANLFMCPCHGGAFFRDGTVAAGPPPVALVRYPVRVRAQQVEIQTVAPLIPE